jgi:hypothetical protein
MEKNRTLWTILSMVTSFEYARINWNLGTRPPVHNLLIILPRKGKPSHFKVKKIIWLSVLAFKVKMHHASSNGANGQPVIQHGYSGTFNRSIVLLKTSFGLMCWFFIIIIYLVIRQYQWCCLWPKSKPQQWNSHCFG